MQTTCEIKARTTSNNKSLVIDVEGYFNVNCLTEFREAFETRELYSRYAVNMRRCQGIDSSGLGMLLLLRDFSQLDHDNLLLTHCPPDVQNVLRYANFGELFTILS